MKYLWTGVLGIALLSSVSCARAVPLENAETSAEALASSVLDAVARRDRPRLERLVLSEQEFREHVWPALPSSRSQRNLPFSYVWGELHQKSQLNLSNALGLHGGSAYRLKRLRFAGTTNYGQVVVHREATLEVTDPAGAERSIRVCGAFLEKGGLWKVFSYVVDE